ncbi:extracellular solute-binding protein [Pararhizobium sp. IMCC21322]|uniref:extracellular solute-binding protein n=1 Tax=Pararhizobium sp. IMCC21322 TaxID=3067903 RepID=UPI00274160B9|nr:extracellular solute-binding protein [Pararhizobium sp. IMCC21322]
MRFHNRFLVTAAILTSAFGTVSASHAVDLSIVTGWEGRDLQILRANLAVYEDRTGNKVEIVPLPRYTNDQFERYSLWLTAQNEEIDLYMTDSTWAPQLSEHFLDMTFAAENVIPNHFPVTIESQTVDGKLLALPIYAEATALYYRKDLLEKHVAFVPASWSEMVDTARSIQEAERAGGNLEMVGFVFPGALGEDLTATALEWIKSHGGGQIVEPDGTISINNTRAAEALKIALSWIGDIAPLAVLEYTEEDARKVWDAGNAVFFRASSDEFARSKAENAPLKDLFEMTSLPIGQGGSSPAATLGGWNVAVSRYTPHPEEATALALFLASSDVQEQRAIQQGKLPTIVALYNDIDVTTQQPGIRRWKGILENAVQLPAAATKHNYNVVNSEFWTAVHNTLSASGSAEENVTILERRLKRVKGANWR